MDNTLRSLDRAILNWARWTFTDSACSVLIRRLIPKFTLIYGATINHPCLRPAILLYCLPFFDEYKGHEQLATQEKGTTQESTTRYVAGWRRFWWPHSSWVFTIGVINGVTWQVNRCKDFYFDRRTFKPNHNSGPRFRFTTFCRLPIWNYMRLDEFDLERLITPSEDNFHSRTLLHSMEWCETLDLAFSPKLGQYQLCYNFIVELKFPRCRNLHLRLKTQPNEKESAREHSASCNNRSWLKSYRWKFRPWDFENWLASTMIGGGISKPQETTIITNAASTTTNISRDSISL